jgi:hypothetical protein
MNTPFLPGFRPSLAALGRSLRSVRSKPIPELQLFFKSLFPDHVFDREAAGPNSRDRIFTLQRTFWLFLHQALNPKTSLREACHHLRSLLELSSSKLCRFAVFRGKRVKLIRGDIRFGGALVRRPGCALVRGASRDDPEMAPRTSSVWLVGVGFRPDRDAVQRSNRDL